MTDEKEPTNAPLSEGFVEGDETWTAKGTKIKGVKFAPGTFMFSFPKTEKELHKMGKKELRGYVQVLETMVQLRDRLIQNYRSEELEAEEE
jgi:hypothetical protein